MSEQGLRYNENKPVLSFLDEARHALAGCAQILMFGAKKYSRGNWLKGLPWIEGIYDSMRRHEIAFLNGEDLDPETKLPHVDHILCNALFLSEMYHTRKDLDDRTATQDFMQSFKNQQLEPGEDEQ